MPNIIEVGVAFLYEINKVQKVESVSQVVETGRRGGKIEEGWSLG